MSFILFTYNFVDVLICRVFMVFCFIIRSIKNNILFLMRNCRAVIPVTVSKTLLGSLAVWIDLVNMVHLGSGSYPKS